MQLFFSFEAAAEKQEKKKYYDFMSKSVNYLKFLGFLTLTLHELIKCEKIDLIEKRIKCLSSGKKSQPALLNQYDDNGKKRKLGTKSDVEDSWHKYNSSSFERRVMKQI